MNYLRPIFIFLLSIIFIALAIFISSCSGKGMGGALFVPGLSNNQPPLFSVSSFKLTGSNPQPQEISFGYYNNTFFNFAFINLNIQSGLSLFSINPSANFVNQLSGGKRVLIWGTAWKDGNFNATLKDIFWVGKIVDNPVNIVSFTVAGSTYKTVGGRNFVARFNNGAFDSNFDNLILIKPNGTQYNKNTDLDDVNEDFRAVAFKSDGGGTTFGGSIVGRNIAFYSTNPLGNWNNALANNVSNRPTNFIAFDVLHLSFYPSLLFVGSNIDETSGEGRIFSSSTNSWGSNLSSTVSTLAGVPNGPLYSVDAVSDSLNRDNISAVLTSGRGVMLYWRDINNNGELDPVDTLIAYGNPNLTFYGCSLVKFGLNNNFFLVGYDNSLQEAIIYKGTAVDNDNNNIIDTAPTKVNLSNLGINLKDFVFFDVTTIGNSFVFVVGVDVTATNHIKPYIFVDTNGDSYPLLTKSFIFKEPNPLPSATYNLDNAIRDLFQNMRGVIIYSDNGGNTFRFFTGNIRN